MSWVPVNWTDMKLGALVRPGEITWRREWDGTSEEGLVDREGFLYPWVYACSREVMEDGTVAYVWGCGSQLAIGEHFTHVGATTSLEESRSEALAAMTG